MRKILVLIISLLLLSCLFSCTEDDASDTPDVLETTKTVGTTEAIMTTAPDDETDEPATKVDYLTSVDEEINGFSVKGEKYYYEYNDEDFLIFDVENLTDKVQMVEISVTFYDEKGNEVSKEIEYFPDFPAGDTQSFIFRTTEKFAGFTYELDAKEYTNEPVFTEINFEINGLRRIDITDQITGNKVPSLCADINYGVNKNSAVSSVRCMCNVIAFDSEGTVQSLSTMYQFIVSSKMKSVMFLRKIPEDYAIPLDELNVKVIFSDITYKYIEEETDSNVSEEASKVIQSDIIKNYDKEKVFDNEISVKEKKYTLDGKDLLLLNVENPTDISYGITISVTYFDESGTQIKKQVQRYDWFCANYQKYFLFRPGKTFDGYKYEIDFVKAEEDIPRFLTDTDAYVSGWSVLENEESINLPGIRLETYIENQSDYNVRYVYSYMVFDDKGELYDIIETGMYGELRSNSDYTHLVTAYNFDEKDPSSLDEVADRFDGQTKAIMIIMDAEIIENYDEIYGN